MEPAGASDVDVLDDLLHDVDGEGDDFEDAEAFFDTDPDRDGDGDEWSADNILSQLDAVTSLDVDDDVQGEYVDEFHDSTSAPSSLQLDDASKGAVDPLDDDVIEEKSDSTSAEVALPEQAQLSPLSGDDVVQSVLDLATDADDQAPNEAKQTREPSEDEVPTSKQELDTPQDEEKSSNEAERELSTDVPTEDTDGDAVVDEILDAVEVSTDRSGRTLDVDTLNNEPPPTPPTHETMSEMANALPPPAPTTVPVIVGYMNPVEEDNDDSEESQGEDDSESAPLPSPLRLDTADDDEDVLEVDAAVVSSLHIEEKQRLSKSATSTDEPLETKTTHSDEDNAQLKALPNTKAEDRSALDLPLGEEVRVAHVATLEPSSPFSDLHKAAGGSKLSPDATFGISYQNMRKKYDEPAVDDDAGGSYSLPSGPAFPDEREFENEMDLASDLAFSVATTTSASPGKGGNTGEDDEFAFDVEPADQAVELSEAVLRARRESLEAKKRKDEEELVEELKRATDEEKKRIESSKASENGQPDAATSGQRVESDELSITELHSIYKRGLGDQGVLMDENDEKELSGKPDAPLGRSMSVLGRLFSQTQGSTDTIVEEAGGEESEDDSDGDEDVLDAEDENADDAKTITEKSDVDEAAEWREIKLVQHESGADTTAKASRPETASVSRMSYAEAAGYYAETPDVMQHRDIIVSEDFPRGSCFTCLSRPRLAFPGAIEERDRIFCIAATAFDAHNDVVVGMLQSIYRKITKSPRDVLLIGRHWEDIGFQGTDPSTDLRGCGVLSLLQMLYLVETFPDLAHRFHALSEHPTRHFPFACVLINITLQCVVALRTGALYPECNKHASVLCGMNRLYVALAAQLHDAIQSRSDEIPLIMRDVLECGRASPTKAIDEAFDGSSLRPSRPATASKSTNSKPKTAERKESDNTLEFTEIGLHSVDEEG